MTNAPDRKRMKRYDVPGVVRFVTFSCERRLPLLGNASIRNLFVEVLYAARARFGFELFAWVVMPEHVHLLVRPRAGVPLARVLRFIKQSVATRVVERWKELRAPILDEITRADGRPRFWLKGGGFDRNVRDQDELVREIRYIHRNPVERSLVEAPEQWAWSSVRWWMGIGVPDRPCDVPPGIPKAWKGYV